MQTGNRFSVYNFTDGEIEQIVRLLEKRAMGSIRPIDRRRYSKQVQEWAIAWNVLDWGRNITRYEARGDELVKVPETWIESPDRLYFKPYGDFDFVHCMPTEALWKMVEPIVRDRSGYSITADRRWRTFDVWEAGNKHSTNDDINKIFRILVHLQMHGYIIFQAAGSIWRVEIGGWKH